MTLARDAQSRGDYREANIRVIQVLNADPTNPEALAFKRKNDQLLDSIKGKTPSQEALDVVPQVVAQKQDAGTLVRDGKLFYEMGKLDEAQAKFKAALQLD